MKTKINSDRIIVALFSVSIVIIYYIGIATWAGEQAKEVMASVMFAVVLVLMFNHRVHVDGK